MMGFRRFCRLLVLPVAMLFAASTLLPGLAAAGMVGTDEVIEQRAAAAERERVESFLARDEVQAELAAYGVDPAEAKARVAALSDAEIAKLAGHLDAEPAGEGAASTIIGAAVFVFVVLLITDILGFTNVFPFVLPQR